MPLYEYRCEHCRRKTEVIQSFSEKPLKICPHCGKRGLKKLFSAPAIQFKGTGWYVTDYAGKKGPEPASGESSAEKSETKEKAEKGPKPEKKKPKKES